jgi:hypothetical protein
MSSRVVTPTGWRRITHADALEWALLCCVFRAGNNMKFVFIGQAMWAAPDRGGTGEKVRTTLAGGIAFKRRASGRKRRWFVRYPEGGSSPAERRAADAMYYDAIVVKPLPRDPEVPL